MENWKTVPAFGNHYEASNIGNIRVKDRIVTKFNHLAKGTIDQFYKGKILKKIDNGRGYHVVSIGVNKKCYSVQVGRMILMAFKGLPKVGEFCCHNNSNPSDNRIENLRWGDQKDNMKDRMARGKYLSCEDHFMSKLTNKQVLEIYNSNEVGTRLAETYKTSTHTISKIRKGKLWKNITGGMDRKIGKNYIGKRPGDKFNPEIIKEIRKLREETGIFYKEIAKKYNTSSEVIWKICKRKTWQHVE